MYGWKHHVALVESDGSAEANGLLEPVLQLLAAEPSPGSSQDAAPPRVRLVDKKELLDVVKAQGMKGKDVLPSALQHVIETDRSQEMDLKQRNSVTFRNENEHGDEVSVLSAIKTTGIGNPAGIVLPLLMGKWMVLAGKG